MTAFLVSCHTGQQAHVTDTVREVCTAAAGDVVSEELFTARIEGKQDVDIFPQVSGRIESICISEGQRLEKGQVMFIIDQVPYKAALRVADANVQAAKAKVESTALELEGKQALAKENVISEFDLSLAKNAHAIAQAQLEQALAEQTNAKNDLSYTRIESPVNGVAGTLPYREGTLVGPTTAKPLTTVSDNSMMYVYFSLSENRLRALFSQYGSKEAMISSMKGLELRLSDGSTYPYDGHLESVSGVLNESTGTAQMRCVFPNPDGTLLSGASGCVVIPFKYENVISIPAESAFEIQGMHFVQKVVGGKAQTSQIQVEASQDGRTYIVLGGLEAGDSIVAGGAGLVHDGDIIS